MFTVFQHTPEGPTERTTRPTDNIRHPRGPESQGSQNFPARRSQQRGRSGGPAARSFVRAIYVCVAGARVNTRSPKQSPQPAPHNAAAVPKRPRALHGDWRRTAFTRPPESSQVKYGTQVGKIPVSKNRIGTAPDLYGFTDDSASFLSRGLLQRP